jgi:hypothetical protein
VFTVFDTCRIDAYVPSTKSTALHAFLCPDELTRWLVGEGLDVDAPDAWGETALAMKAMHDQDLSVLLELGANVNAANDSGFTVLHRAVPRSPRNVRILLDHGADVRALNDDGHTPLQSALERCGNADIAAVGPSARILLDAGSPSPANAADLVSAIAKRYARIRGDGRNRESTDRGLTDLYELFDVTPAAPRRTHDGTSPITVAAAKWPDQFNELWELLVPPGGVAPTLQGEVIRLVGKISRELRGNGGINWNRDFQKMKNALINYLDSGTTVTIAAELADLAPGLRRDFDDRAVIRVGELSVAWVLANPDPVPPPRRLKYRG